MVKSLTVSLILLRYPSYMWKFVSSVLGLGETLRTALQSGDMVSHTKIKKFTHCHDSFTYYHLSVDQNSLGLKYWFPYPLWGSTKGSQDFRSTEVGISASEYSRLSYNTVR